MMRYFTPLAMSLVLAVSLLLITRHRCLRVVEGLESKTRKWLEKCCLLSMLLIAIIELQLLTSLEPVCNLVRYVYAILPKPSKTVETFIHIQPLGSETDVLIVCERECVQNSFPLVALLQTMLTFPCGCFSEVLVERHNFTFIKTLFRCLKNVSCWSKTEMKSWVSGQH